MPYKNPEDNRLYREKNRAAINVKARLRHAEKMASDPEYVIKKKEARERQQIRSDFKERQREACKRSYIKHAEKRKIYNKKWRERNDRSEYMLNWSRKNKDKRRASYDKWRHAKRGIESEFIIRHDVWEKCQGVCGICNLPVQENNWHLDHIIPLSRGGTHTMNNVQVSHSTCNLSKGNKLSEEMTL